MPKLIPKEAYYDADWYTAEIEHVFGQTWILGAYTSEIPLPGDYTTIQVGHESIVLVNTGNGIQGYVNICRHRCLQLTMGAGNCGKRFRCDYHAWEYDIVDGHLTKVPQRANQFPGIDLQDLGLIRVATHSSRGLVFVNLSDHPPAF